MSCATQPAFATEKPNPQDEVNRAVYYSPHVYRYYLSDELTAPERACFSAYQWTIRDREVLDVGVGAGRTSPYLCKRARRYEAIDYSPVMVDYVRRHAPGISIRQADFRDLSMFPDRSFDFVFATDCVIDALSHADRLKALQETARVLRRGGIIAFSSHNLRYRKAFAEPEIEWSPNPLRLGRNTARYLLQRRNHARVGPLRKITPEYALLNDTGHHYACLHYYASRETVRLQLAQLNMCLLDVFGRDGSRLAPNADDRAHASLLYVAAAPPNAPAT